MDVLWVRTSFCLLLLLSLVAEAHEPGYFERIEWLQRQPHWFGAPPYPLHPGLHIQELSKTPYNGFCCQGQEEDPIPISEAYLLAARLEFNAATDEEKLLAERIRELLLRYPSESGCSSPITISLWGNSVTLMGQDCCCREGESLAAAIALLEGVGSVYNLLLYHP